MTHEPQYTPVLIHLRGGGLLDCLLTETDFESLHRSGAYPDHIYVKLTTGKHARIRVAAIDAMTY